MQAVGGRLPDGILVQALAALEPERQAPSVEAMASPEIVEQLDTARTSGRVAGSANRRTEATSRSEPWILMFQAWHRRWMQPGRMAETLTAAGAH